MNGKQLVFFGGGDGYCYAFDAKPVKEGDGSFLKTVWKYDCNPPNYKVQDGKPIKYPAAARAIEAVAASSPFRNVPPVEVYDQWKSRIVAFDGKDACG